MCPLDGEGKPKLGFVHWPYLKVLEVECVPPWLAAIPPRDDPRDALIVKPGLPYTSLKELPEGAILRRLYIDLRFANIRGNVETRLAKVDKPDSEYTCMIISVAGLERVSLKYRINQYLQSKNGGIFHAVGQGALGLEIRKGDTKMQKVIDQLGDRKSTLACLAERSLMRTLEGGCSVPIGVETEWIHPEDLKMKAIVVSLDGSEGVEDSLEGSVQTIDDAMALGKEMAARLVKAGAEAILKDINMSRPSKD
ncbi:uncharacterized protein N7500_008110 [Penicillium coprophilum]|uniref:uncharacterized protein n=1 Tax=Penicillium coprophilum TaxID=36646 RepID=UPI00239221C1|nr:uncharacterized protein N7500_008110 [Penicillium coprophilum]KAJ5158459.1 hypothetical protein N7500_008110 [Penicillium coprophilum]